VAFLPSKCPEIVKSIGKNYSLKTHTRTHTHTHAHTHTKTHAHTRTHTHAHTRTHTCTTHVQTPTCSSACDISTTCFMPARGSPSIIAVFMVLRHVMCRALLLNMILCLYIESVPLSVMCCAQGACYCQLCVVRRECATAHCVLFSRERATVSYALYAGSVLQPIVYCSVGSVLLSVMRCTQGVCYSPLCIVQ